MIRKAILGLLLITASTGFGALPAKPDFAFPKTVSTNAQARLKAAEKNNDGPATVRALIDYSLAQTAINPDRSDKMLALMAEVEGRAKEPATKAMIQLLRAKLAMSDSLAADAVNRYTAELRATETRLWEGVVEADVQFFPTLYDFAIGAATNLPDSIINAAIAYDRNRPYPLIYLEQRRTHGFNELRELYKRFAAQPAGVYPMLGMAHAASNLDERKEAYALLSALPDPDDAVKRALSYLQRPDIHTEHNSIVGRGKEFKIKVEVTCLNKAVIDVEMVKPTPKKLKSITLTFPGQGVWKADTTVTLTLSDYGEYRLTPRFETLKERHPSQGRFVVTDFLLSQQSFGKKLSPVMALDVINGSEQKGVSFSTVRNQIKGTRGADAYSPSIYSGSYEPSQQQRRFANIVTDRAIYHPGDSVRFAATLMKARGTSRSLASGQQAKITLRNANYEDIDSMRLTADDFGRINGAFALPEEGLTGNFGLKVDDYGFVSFTVADYKAPTFDVKLKAERIDSTTVELRGSAIGYNGFPIADARVALSVAKLPEWVWYRTYSSMKDETVGADTVTTDARGEFTALLTVPSGANLAATASAASPTGETHDADAFIPYYRYFIDGDIGSYTNALTPPVFKVRGAENKIVDRPMSIILTTSTDTIYPDKEWANVPSGAYNIIVSSQGARRAEFATQVYRPTDKMPPVESGLFIPVTVAKPGDSLLVGTSFADSHIRMVKWTPDTIIEEKWITPEAGNFFVDISLPDSINDATLTFHTLRNYRFEERIVHISRPDVARKLNLKVESMRGNITPGETERWTIRVDNNLEQPQKAAVMLLVYSRALDALSPLSWHFTVPPVWGRNLNFADAASYSDGTYNSATPRLDYPFAGISARFNLWGQHWPHLYENGFGERITFTSMKMTAGNIMVRGTAAYDLGTDDVAVEECEADEACDSAAPVLAESEVATETENRNADGDYRMPEVPVALWQPVLTTAADGSLEVTFTAPNANTTWGVRGLAYNKRLLSGLFDADVIASKPVMVQPQLPRFVRSGDRIELTAMVQNATDSAASINSMIEVFNPANDSILDRREFADTVGARSHALISSYLTAPAGSSFIGIRVRATSGNFTDGEQTLIPVLSADMKITAGTPVFLPSDSTEVALKVARGGTVTFTTNAAWECVAALPALSAPEGRSALTATGALFSAATARGLMRQHPEIARAIHSWESDDSIFVSRLMRNEDLKMALLASTPFVAAAQSESDRRAALTLLFNNRLTDKIISNAISTLTKLQRKGGLTWVEGNDEPSEWITMEVLSTLGDLKRLGYMPNDRRLNQLIAQALEYLDREVAKAFARDKKTTFPAYVMLRSRFPEVRQSAPAQRAAAATVQDIVRHWRDLSLSSLAEAAVILNENGYPSTAAKLLESLRQREAWAQMPLSPTLLNAFASIEPKCAEVEIIRNDYLRRKQSSDWGNGANVSALIAAILNSGETWLVPSANSLNVKVNGEPAAVTANDYLGEFRLDLPEGGDVEITKGRFPAWGGVFSASTDSITSIEAFGSDDLKISRSITGTMAPGEKITVKLTLEASQRIDYVMVTQPLCAGFQTQNQLPGRIWSGYSPAYREPLASQVNYYFNSLPKGKTQLTETFYVTASGTFILAPARAQSQYAPEFQAHTAGSYCETEK